MPIYRLLGGPFRTRLRGYASHWLQGAQTAQDAFQQDLKRARNLEGRPIEVLDSAKLLNAARQDYVGALIASLAFPMLLLPSLGVMRTSLVIGIVNALVGLWATWLLRAQIKGSKFCRDYLNPP